MKRDFAIIILAAVALSSCAYWGDKDDKFAKCPGTAMVLGAQGWIAPPGDAWTARAEISEYDAECTVGKTAVTISIKPKIKAERSGDVSNEAKQDLPLFLAVERGDQIVDKKTFTDTVEFSAGRKFTDDDNEISIELPFGNGGDAADRIILLGFQLDDGQLAYFRAMRDKEVQNAITSASTPPVPAK